MDSINTKVAAGGRILIPAAFRRTLGLEPGQPIVLRVADGELHICSRAAAVQRAQQRVRALTKGKRSLVAELRAERRAEAEAEAEA